MSIPLVNVPCLLSKKQRCTINDFYKPTSLLKLHEPTSLLKLYTNEELREKYTSNYTAFHDAEFVLKCRDLENGINYSTKRKISKTGKVYQEMCNELYYDYHTSIGDYEKYLADTSLHNMSLDAFVSKKIDRYLYATRREREENEKYIKEIELKNKEIELKNKEIEEENENLYISAVGKFVEKEKEIDEYNKNVEIKNVEIAKERKKAKEENLLIKELNKQMYNDCSVEITYNGVVYRQVCNNKNCTAENCPFRHTCDVTKYTIPGGHECGSCRMFFGCGGYCTEERVVYKCSICGEKK